MRRDLLISCELREVSVFPDKVFQFADVETAIILGRKLGSEAESCHSFTFRRVREMDMPRFVAGYFATVNTTSDPAKIKTSKDLNLVVPDLLAVWDALNQNPRFSRIAHIGNGFLFLSEENAKFPIGEVKVSDTKREGFVEGFEKATGSPDTHLLPELKWLNQKQGIIAAPRSGTQRGSAQIILSYVRVSRGAWRLKAFIDLDGRPATDAFLVIRPTDSRWSMLAYRLGRRATSRESSETFTD